MKMSKKVLARIIKEEISGVLREFDIEAFGAETGAGESEEDKVARINAKGYSESNTKYFNSFHAIATNDKAAQIAGIGLSHPSHHGEMLKAFNIVYRLLSQAEQGHTKVALRAPTGGWEDYKCPDEGYDQCRDERIREYEKVMPPLMYGSSGSLMKTIEAMQGRSIAEKK